MKKLLLLVALVVPAFANTIATASFTLTGARYSSDGFTFTTVAEFSPVYVPAGTVEVIFVGTVTNTDTVNPLNLNDQSVSGLSAHLTLDTNSLGSNSVPGYLDANDGVSPFYTYTGDIFNIFIDPGTVPGTYSGSYSLLGGATGFSTGDSPGSLDTISGPVSFAIVVTPEPYSAVLMLSGLGIVALRRMRRL